MLTTWNQRMYRAVQSYVRQNILDEDRVQVVKRALYFGQYKVAIHFSPTVSNWTDYNDLQKEIMGVLRGRDFKMVGSSRALYFNVYSNDPEVFRQLRFLGFDTLDFNSIHVIDESCWNLHQARRKNKGRFYHKFTYRVRVSEGVLTPDQYPSLIQGPWSVSRCFFYCEEVRDLLMFKLLHGSDIVDLSERS